MHDPMNIKGTRLCYQYYVDVLLNGNEFWMLRLNLSLMKFNVESWIHLEICMQVAVAISVSDTSPLSLNYTHAVAGCCVPLVRSFKASGAAGRNEIWDNLGNEGLVFISLVVSSIFRWLALSVSLSVTHTHAHMSRVSVDPAKMYYAPLNLVQFDKRLL